MAEYWNSKLELIEDSFAYCRQEIDTKCEELQKSIEVMRMKLISELELELTKAKANLENFRSRLGSVTEIEKLLAPMDTLSRSMVGKVRAKKREMLEHKGSYLQVKWNVESWPCFDTLATIATESAPSYKLKTRPIKSFAPFSSTFRNVVPERIAVDSETNYIAVTDSEQRNVHIFTPEGELYNSINHAFLKRPHGVFIGSDKVYVTDVRTHHVLIFSLNGDLIKRFGGKGNTPHKLNYPSGVFVCHEGSDEHIYVCDKNNNGVSIFNPSGICCRRLAYKLLMSPVDIKIDQSSIYVLHHDGNCVSVFDKNGTMLKRVVSSGTEGVVAPRAFDIDGEGNLFILDSGTDTIKVFDGEGKWVHSLDNAGGFKECVGVAISGGDVYVLSRQGVNGIHKY